VLADELNRAIPRTQSAFLEAMAERQVSVDGQTHALDEPFMVVATQNPVEHRGVNDLPEAQLDRFQMLVSPGYPAEDDERRILLERQTGDPMDILEPVIGPDRVAELSKLAAQVRTEQSIIDYILRIARATRETESLLLGASPRAALQIMELARAYALTQGRDYVVPDDIKALAKVCLAHRLIPKEVPEEALTDAETKALALDAVLADVPPPKA
jgi:MoxR-like ATPase